MSNGNQPRYPEEELAENLRRRLLEQVASRLSGTVVSVTPMGVNSSCDAKRELRASTIYCFSGPEYLARFDEKPDPPLRGRTFVEAEAVGAVGAWLQGSSPEEVCSRYPFIGRNQRVLAQLRDSLLAAEPTLLERATHELTFSEGSDRCTLYFRTADRVCQVYYFAHNRVPECQFYWDECIQFGAQMAEVPNSNVQTSEEDYLKALHSGKLASWNMGVALDAKRTILLARLMKRWLCDQVMPSEIQHEYPWIVLSEFAPWYEQGRGIEGEFVASWRCVRDRYQGRSDKEPVSAQVVRFINRLCEIGYDRKLRAGLSLNTLLLSRARRHGLRHAMPNEPFDPIKHDPYMAFCFGGLRFNPDLAEGHMEVTAYLEDGERALTYPRIELTAELKTLLNKLQAIPIMSRGQ